MNRAIALAFACFLAHVHAAVAAPKVVVIFGDSITAGGMLPAEERSKLWVNLVQKEAGDRMQLVNEGKGGRPTNSVKEFEAMLERRPQADLLVIPLGTNDSRDITTNCVPKAVANVRAMIDRARKAWGKDVGILLVGPPNIRKDALGPTKPIANERDAKLREIGDGFAALAKEVGCDYMTLYGVVPPESLAKDGVHPDAAGNVVIAQVMAAKLLGKPHQ